VLALPERLGPCAQHVLHDHEGNRIRVGPGSTLHCNCKADLLHVIIPNADLESKVKNQLGIVAPHSKLHIIWVMWLVDPFKDRLLAEAQEGMHGSVDLHLKS
jgi:hypothetical protein